MNTEDIRISSFNEEDRKRWKEKLKKDKSLPRVKKEQYQEWPDDISEDEVKL